MSFSGDVKKEIISLKVWDNNSYLKQDDQLARLILREAFIKSGFINDPKKEYHLEILFKKQDKADETKEILDNFGINSNITKKGNNIMIYIKEGEDISDFLGLIGASRYMLAFEETRVVKETRNKINRLVNCETANLNKTVNAAVKQISDIRLLKKKRAFDNLPEILKEVAELRLKNTDMSYEEIGQMLEPKISKSGVNHRLNRISKIAEEYRGDK